MTSFINDVLSDYLSNKYDLSEKIYEVDALPDIDVDDKSKTLISDYEASGLIGSKYEKPKMDNHDILEKLDDK